MTRPGFALGDKTPYHAQMLATLNTLQEDALQEITALDSLESLESWRISYLGSKGRLKGVMPLMKDVSKEDKPAVGKRLNEVKTTLESAFDSRKADIAGSSSPRPPLDITEPGVEAQDGRRHIITKTIDGITFNIKRNVRNNHIIKDIHITDSKTKHHFQEKVKALTLADFSNFITNSGLKIIDIFGNYKLEEFNAQTSDRLILICKK